MWSLLTLVGFICVHEGESSSPVYYAVNDDSGSLNNQTDTHTVENFQDVGHYYYNPNLNAAPKYSSAFEEASVMYDDYRSQALYIYKFFCGQSCQKNFTMRPNRYCDSCYCDSICNYYGDCCPDYEDLDISRLVNFSCQSSNVPFYGNFIKLVDSCPESYSDEEIVRKCVHTNSEDWRSVQLVTDPKTLVSYRNRYCAMCHKAISDLIKWQPGAVCEKGPPKFHSHSSYTDVYRKTINTFGCKITFIPPFNETFRECGSEVQYKRICNTTSKWQLYDPLVEHACATFPESPALYYPNVFCYMCNTYRTWEDIKHDTVAREPNVFKESLSALLDLHDEYENPEKECQITDSYKCTCRNISCAEGKKYENGECRSFYQTTNSYMYKFCIDGTLVFNTSSVSPNDIMGVINDFRVFIKKIKGVIDYGLFDPTYVSPCGAQITLSFRFNLQVFFRQPINIEYFEKQILSLENNKMNLTKEFMETIFTVRERCEENVIDIEDQCRDFKFDYQFITERTYDNDENKLISRMDILYFSRIASCPRVFLSEDEVELPSNQSLRIIANNKTVQSGNFKLKRGGYFVCLDDYLLEADPTQAISQCDKMSGKNLKAPKFSILGIFSGICTCLSVLFLLLTLVIFCALKRLRTSIGLGIMALSLSLLMAQILFEFGAEQTDFPWVCQAIGVVTHFFWLSSTFWMNVCTVILFYKLNFPIKSRTYSSKMIILYSTLFTWGSSTLIAIVIMTSYLNDGSIGYGGSSCYISTSNSRRFGFALPVGIIVLINVTLFSYTFFKLKTTNKLQSTHENRVSMLGCLKLSVITGLTWIFAFIFEATGYIVFAYIFTLCIGLQGVAIFWAFLANRRVLIMIKAHLGLSKASVCRSHSRQSSSKNDSGINSNDSFTTTKDQVEMSEKM